MAFFKLSTASTTRSRRPSDLYLKKKSWKRRYRYHRVLCLEAERFELVDRAGKGLRDDDGMLEPQSTCSSRGVIDDAEPVGRERVACHWEIRVSGCVRRVCVLNSNRGTDGKEHDMARAPCRCASVTHHALMTLSRLSYPGKPRKHNFKIYCAKATEKRHDRVLYPRNKSQGARRKKKKPRLSAQLELFLYEERINRCLRRPEGVICGDKYLCAGI